MVCMYACDRKQPPPTAPTVNTIQVYDVTSNGATVTGNVVSDGGSPIILRGMCWSDSLDPLFSNGDTLTVRAGKGMYIGRLDSLVSGRSYRVRAFAVNAVDTSYGRVLSFVAGRGTDSCGVYPVFDIDGNSYTSRVIGGYCWILRNLRTSRYANGDSIEAPITRSDWATVSIGARALYTGDSSLWEQYGLLYNWRAVVDPRGLCPTGWRLPTADEWSLFVSRLDGWAMVGGLIKSRSYWSAPNTAALDHSNFRALPGGWRDDLGLDRDLTYSAYFWSETERNPWNAAAFSLRHNSGGAFLPDMPKTAGLSVRCIKP